ncbi:MAG: peptidase M23 [Desulfuromonas sp.]|nr:MAG: peptidase M23 [Desulfuromonas sp.]
MSSRIPEDAVSAKKFTFLIIPEGSHQVRRFNIKRSVLKGWVAFAAVVLIGLTTMTVDYVLSELDQAELTRLQAENRQQRNELQRLVAGLEDLQTEMRLLAQTDAKVRIMADLSKPKSNTMVGIGGPPEIDENDSFSQLQTRIDQMRRDIDLRRESQEEIQGFLNDQRSMVGAEPSGWPVKGWLTSSFGMRKSPFTGKRKMHEGYDIAARTGTPVYATADGVVSKSETVPGYGKLVIIEHGYGYRTYYGHNSKNLVRAGQRVVRGQQISKVGNTGRSTGSHVHYEIRRNGVPVNPKKFL